MSRWLAVLVAACLTTPIAQAQSERAAIEREPYADAPGTTPVEEPTRPRADSPDQHVRVSGYYRVRGDLGFDWDLNRGPTPTTGTGIWPGPYTSSGRSRTQTHLDMRLRLDGEVLVGWGVSLHARLDVLDDLVLGSTPEGAFTGGVTSARSPDRPIDVRQVYGQVVLPFGVLAAGRMGALVDWGTGFFVSAGNGLDDDFGDVGDRLALTVPAAGLLWTAAYEMSASGPSTDAVRRDIRPAIDLDPADDVRTLAFAVARWDPPETLRRRRAAGRTTLHAGLLASYRWQRYDLAPGSTPSEAGRIARGLDAMVADGWARLDVGRLTLEAEGAFARFSIDNASLDPTVALAEPITGTQWGGVARADYRASPRLFARLEAGIASGDSHPGFGVRDSGAPAVPGDLDGPQLDLGASPPDTTIDNFRFHPNYRVDLILFRRILGTVTDAFYVRPTLRWRPWSLITLEGAVIASFALQRNSTPSGQAPLGVETDLGVIYEQEHGFVARLDYGLLVPLSGFRNVPLGIDPSVAHALHLLLAYRY